MCFAPQRRALFRHLNFQKWSGAGVLCTFWLGHVLHATTACNFNLSSGQMATHPTLRSHQSLEKHSESRLFYLFADLHLLSSDSFPSLIFSLLLFSSLTLPTSAFPSVHIVGSLTSRLPSIIPELIINQQGFWTLLMCVLICWWLLCNCNPRLCTGFALDPCLPCQALYVAWIVPGNIWSECAQQSKYSKYMCVYIYMYWYVIYICTYSESPWFSTVDLASSWHLGSETWVANLGISWPIEKRAAPCTSQIAAQSRSKDFVVSPAWFQHGSAMLGYKHVQEKKLTDICSSESWCSKSWPVQNKSCAWTKIIFECL